MPPVDVIQSVLAPASQQSSSIHNLWSSMLWVSVVVFALVLAAVFAALRRGLRRGGNAVSPASDRRLSRAVAAAVGVTILILIALLVASVSTGRSVASLHASSGVAIAITGHQWWWEVEYEDAVPSRRVVTANEIHIPTNRSVVLKVTSHD